MRRRIQRLAIAVIVAVAVSLAAASQAGAVGETIGGCVQEKTIHALEKHDSAGEAGTGSDAREGLTGILDELAHDEEFADDLEDCLESPSPIFPALDEIIWGGAAFLILLAFMKWKGFPAVKRAMDARSERIRADLNAADEAKTSAKRTQSEYEAQLAQAKSASAKIVDDARAQAVRLGNELKARAEAEIAEQRSKAAADIESSRQQAIDDLRGEIAAIAVAAAERVVGASLNEEMHRSLIDSCIDELAVSGGNRSAKSAKSERGGEG